MYAPVTYFTHNQNFVYNTYSEHYLQHTGITPLAIHNNGI